MDYQTLLANDGYARLHAKKTMQEITGALIALCESDITSITLWEDDQELQDWNQQVVMVCGGMTIKVWIECSSDTTNQHPGEYCFRCLAIVDSTPVDVGFSTYNWQIGAEESGVDAMIAQLTAIEMSVVTIARTVQEVMHA
jgi:hypothetical protein